MKKKTSLHEPARILQVTHLKGFNVALVFKDGFTKVVNLKKYLHGPAFRQARSDPDYFRQVFIDPIGETVTWPNTEDIDADVLRYDLTPTWMEKKIAQKKSAKNGHLRTGKEPLVPKHIYLYPHQVKFLSKIDSNTSAAIRKVVDTFQKQRRSQEP